MATPAQTHINRMDSQTRKRRVVNLMGYFEPNATTSPSAATTGIPGVTAVTYAATGKLLVKLDARYKDISVVKDLQIHTPAADLGLVVSDIVLNDTTNNSGNSSILLVFVTVSTGAPVAPPATTTGPLGMRVHLWISAVLGDTNFLSAN